MQLLTAATIAKASTASVGKFQGQLPKEKQARGIGIKEVSTVCTKCIEHASQNTQASNYSKYYHFITIQMQLTPGAKRKQSHITNDIPEKAMNLELINSVLNKKPKIDVDKAISVQKREAREE